ncbi:MAG: TRAP transporter substrate-binding protein [Rhizobiales bacterium]|nr:TRAP transporter substrate-binding protein [Hyphomicrobiales bacterium]
MAEKWDMPMAYSASNYHSENGAAFAACVTSTSGGDLEIVTHPGGSLFKGGEIKRAVQTGQAQIGERLLSAHANENPMFGVDSIPFLATSFDDSVSLWKAASGAVKAALGDQNLIYVYAVPWPPQGLYFKKEVNSVADMKGIKFRAYNAATARIAELAGMVPVQIEAAELSQALSTGVAEAFISSGSTGYDKKVWEQLTHFYDVQAWLPRNTVFVNKDSWNSLSDSNKKAVMECGAKAEADGLATAKKLTQFYLDGLTEGGMTVANPGDSLKAELQAFGETMTGEWLKAAGDAGKSVVDAFKAM